MPVTFDGDSLFGTGPMRVYEGERGCAILVKSRISAFDPGSQAIGPLEVNVHVRGRMIAADRTALQTILDDVTTVLTYPPPMATLTDGLGRLWNDMSFVSFTVGDRVDAGREASVSFEARFVRFLV